MGNFLHRTSKQYLQSTPPDSLLEPLANYIDETDMSAVDGVPKKYWVITGDIISEMTQAEKDTVDAAILSDARDERVDDKIDDIESVLRQLVKMLISEINILRAEHGLSDRTMAQFKTHIRNDLGT